MERVIPAVLAEGAEQFEGLRLRRGGEREVGQVGAVLPPAGARRQLLLGGSRASAVVAPGSSESASKPKSRSTARTGAADSPDCDECASSTRIANRLPRISVGLRFRYSTRAGKVCRVTVTILPVSWESALASCSDLAPYRSSIFTTSPAVCSKLPTVSRSWASRFSRSVMMTTLSKTGVPGFTPAASASGSSAAGSFGVCSDESRWASQAMVFDLPEPAEAMIR